MAALTNGQAQVGGVTVGSQIANPLDTATAGITTGADWAMRNYQVQGQMAMMQQQAQQMQLENMKTRYSIGQTLYDRMQRIARLPMGNAKNSEIDLLGQDMGHLGMDLHPSAVALMKDKELSKGLGTVLNSLQSGDANQRVQAMSQLPYFLSSDKILDMYTEQLKNAQTVNLKQAEMAHGTNLEQMRQSGEDTRQEKKLAAERQMFGVKTTGEIRGEATKNGTEYHAFSQSYEKLLNALNAGTGTQDKVAITMMNQMLGNPTLRQYEANMYGEGAGFIDGLRAKLSGVLKGTSLGPLQRKQIKQAAMDMKAVADRSAQDLMMPAYNHIQMLGVDPKLVFSPRVLNLLNTPAEQMSPLPSVGQPGGQRPQRQAVPGAQPPQGPLSSARQTVNPKTPVMLSPAQVAAGRALVQQLGPDQASKAIAQRMGLPTLSPAMQRQLGIPVAGGQ